MPFDIKDFNYLRKSLKKNYADFKQIRIAILSDSASQFITQSIKGYGIEHHINYVIFEADYNQIDQQVYNPNSELYNFDPDFLIIIKSTEHLSQSFYKKANHEKSDFAQDYVNYIDSLYQTISSRIKCRIIINNYIEINDGIFGHFASKTQVSLSYQLKKLNLLLMDFCQQRQQAFLFDLDALVTQLGYNNSFDAKMYFNADMVFSIDFLPHLAKGMHDIIQANTGLFKKCIILDLDHTLWGGIIGDDGMSGIHIGDLGIGKIFSELQLWVKQLKQRGIIIAICSKNTEEIAKEPFINHSGMVLRLEDIAIFVSNWESKAHNIRYIQSVLNIGMDTMVFIDDNPFERELVKHEIPEITVPELPEDPAEYLSFLKYLNLFETASLTEEDGSRTQQYQESARRAIQQKSFKNEDDYLSSLNMTSEVRPFDSFTIPRVAQLSQRSNQFNLRTVRYTEEDLQKIAASSQYIPLSFTLKDKYGDNGLIALVVLKRINEAEVFIENWAMSCRVLKRGMENFILMHIVKEAVKQKFIRITGEYIPTSKNMMVKEHYLQLGFEAGEENKYHLNLQQQPEIFNKKSFITNI